MRGGHGSIGNGIPIISLYLDLNFFAWVLHNRSWNSRLFRQFFFHVWHIFFSLKFLQILPQSSIFIRRKTAASSHSPQLDVRREALLIGQFEFAANSAAQLSLDENEDGKQGDS